MASIFTLFPDLPPEIRLKIWEHALPGPRIIEFRINSTLYPPFPTLYAVNCEARSVVIENYDTVSLSSDSNADHLSVGYIDHSRDTLLIGYGHGAASLTDLLADGAGQLAKLRSLALDWRTWSDVCEENMYLPIFYGLMRLPSLKQLTLVTAPMSYAVPDPEVEPDGIYNSISGFIEPEGVRSSVMADVEGFGEHFELVVLREKVKENISQDYKIPALFGKGFERVGRRKMGFAEDTSSRAEKMDAMVRKFMVPRDRFLGLLDPVDDLIQGESEGRDNLFRSR